MLSDAEITMFIESLKDSPSKNIYFPLNVLRHLLGLKKRVSKYDRIPELEIENLNKIDNAELQELLIRTLSHKEVELRALAACALGGAKGNPKVIEALRKALLDNASTSIQWTDVAIPLLGYPQSRYYVAEMAGLSLVRLGDKESAKRIVHLALEKWEIGKYNHKEEFFKYMYVLGWESVVEELTLMCKHNKPYYRQRAVSCLTAMCDVLGETGYSDVLNAFTQATQDKDRGVRKAANMAIKQIKAKMPQEQVETMMQQEIVRQEQVKATMQQKIVPNEQSTANVNKKNSLSMISIILGIVSFPLSFCGSGIFFGIAAVITGFVARKQIKESGGMQEGNGVALAGIIIGGIVTVVVLSVLIISIISAS